MKIEQHITAKDLATRLAVEPITIHRLINQKKLTAIKLGRKFCIPLSAAESFIESRTLRAKPRKTA